MEYNDKSKEELLEEINVLKTRISKLEKCEVEHKRAREALRESELKFMSIVTSIGDLVFILDAEGCFTFYHTLEIKDLYLPPGKFIGKKHQEVMPPYLTLHITEAIRKNKNGEIAEYDYPLEIKGETRWYSAKLSPIVCDGEYSGSLAIIRNITKYKK